MDLIRFSICVVKQNKYRIMKLKPNEKARQLLDRFDFEIRDLDGKVSHTREEAIQCALLCVDEIKKSIRWSSDFNNEQKNYWTEVAEIIENFNYT